MRERLFVYGTLRKGLYNYYQYLHENSDFQGYAYIKGCLMETHSGDMPAYLMEGEDMILGEIYEISQETLSIIDKLANYTENHVSSNTYIRQKEYVYNEKGEVIDNVYIYVYNMDNLANIASIGDYIKENDYIQFLLNQDFKKKLFMSRYEDE